MDLSNYAINADLKNSTSVDTSAKFAKFAKTVDLTSLKSNVDKLGFEKLKNVPSGLSSLKSKVDKLDVDGLSDALKNDVVKKDVNNAKIKNIEDKVPAITNLATKTTLNAKINEVKGEIPVITNLATNTGLTAVENKIPDVSNLVKKLTITQ